MSTHEQAVESLLETLYLQVPGTEIDRLRRQLTDGFTGSMKFRGPRSVIILVGNENCFYAYSVEREIAREIRNSMPSLPEGVDNQGISQFVQRVIERMRDKVEIGATPEYPVFTDEMDAMMLVGLLLRMMEGEGRNIDERPNQQLILINLGFRTIEKKNRTMFVATWRKGGQLT